jgi:hypothetical protein
MLGDAMMSIVVKTEGASPGASEVGMFDHRCDAPNLWR